MVKGRKTFTKKGFGRRILSMTLAFVMSFMMFASELPFGLLQVKAESVQTNVTLHFNNAEWGWTTPAIQYWQFDDVTPSGYAAGPTEITGWGGAKGYTLTDEGAGWYSITLTGNIEGFQFLDMSTPSNNTGGQGYHGAMGLYTADTPQDLYYKEDTGEWYLEATYTTLLDYPENAPTYDVTLHYYNGFEEGKVGFYAWGANGEFAGGWPGTEMTKNEEKTGWFDYSQEELKSDSFGCKINCFNDTGKTGDLGVTLAEGTNEVWFYYQDGELKQVTEAPELWLNPPTEDSNGSDSDDNTTTEPGDNGGADKEDEVVINTSYYAKDVMEVKVGDTTYPMNVMVNGIYQADVTLPNGEHTATLIKNGEVTDVTTTINVADEEKDVYFRLSGNDNLTSGVIAPCSAVGTLNTLSTKYGSWNPADPNAELTYIGGGFYKGEITYDVLEDDKAFEYKVAFNDGWDWNIGNGGQGGGNFARTAPAGSTGFTVFVDSINNVVYDTLTTNDFAIYTHGGDLTKKVFDTKISIVGPVRESSADWDAAVTGYEFAQISDTLFRYEKTFANTASYDYKCVFDYSNWYDIEGNQTVVITSPNTHVVFLYDTETKLLYDTINDEAEVAKRLHMNVRPSGMQVVENLNGTHTFIVPAQDGAKVTLYYADKAAVEADGSNALNKTVAATANGGVARFDSIWLGDAAKDVIYYYDVAGSRVIDETSAVTVGDASYSKLAKSAYTGRDVYVPGTFPGPSWDAGSNKMTYEGNQKYSYTFQNVPAAKYEHKISIAASWSENYGVDGIKDGANIGVLVPTKQDVTIYYNDISHRAVNTIDYKIVDVVITGTGIADGTKLTDDGLTGIYTAKVTLPAATYSDIKISYEGKETIFNEFTLSEEKEVTFCLDPITGLCYHNASNVPIDADSIYFDSKDASYKSVYGALATGESAAFALTTGEDVVTANLLIKGVANKAIPMGKDGDVVDGKQRWVATTSFSTIGEYTYYFAVSNGASVAVYGDDDGYYGTGMVSDLTTVKPYDLVVYKAGFETPDWMKNAVIYQIFPDRFFDGDETNNKAQTTARGAVDYEFVENWYTLPENPEQEGLLSESVYKATGAFFGDGQWSNEIYGGDLKGITEKIEYLKALGVTVIYLNPVFSSISSHRYDACDYTKIDPILGTEGDFKELVEVAERNGMKVVLDGVFNHVSDDSIYFDRYYKFLDDGLATIGAYPYWAFVYDYMAENSAATKADAEAAAKAYFTEEYGITDYSYVEWFDVFQTTLKDDSKEEVYDTIGLRTDKPVYGYDGWWGYDSMPIIKSTNGSEYQTGNWAEHIIYNEEGTSVTQYWISEGMDGWRLDVANEVSDETWQRFRESVKGLDSEAVIIGEIWDDATKYILGDMYDSVMNYMFRNAVTNFAMGSGSTDVTKYMERLRERYPKEAFYAMMNLVDSHDTTRILSYLDGVQDDRNQKDVASAFPTYAATSDTAKQRQYLVAFLQFTYAGAPTIYYGDEIGMVGADDPDDRRAFEWGKGNEALVTYYATLADARSKYAALRTGEVESFATGSENVLGYVRRDAKDEIIVLANNSASAVTVTVDIEALNVSADKLSDLLTNNIPNTVEDGEVTITVPAYRGVILVDDNKVKALTVDKKALASAYKTVAPAPTPSNPSHDDDDKHENKPVATPAPTVAPQVTAAPVVTPEVKPVLPTETPKKPELPKIDFSEIKDVKEQAEAIIEVLKDIEEHTDVVIAIETSPEEKKAEISLEVLNAMSGKKEADVNLVIELDNGFSWTIDSSSIDSSVWADGAETIDFWAGVVEDVIPKETLKEVVKEEQKMIEISLNHEGDFGLNASLDIPVGDEFEGKEAVLYYYNEAKSALEEQGRGKVGVDGKVNFLFAHASDYVIVIEDEVPTAETPATENVAVGGTPLAEGAVEEVAMNGVHPMVYVFIIIAVLAFGAGAIIIKKKNSSLED